MTVLAFGAWDAPATDDATWIDVPLELACMHCGERFHAGDNGAPLRSENPRGSDRR